MPGKDPVAKEGHSGRACLQAHGLDLQTKYVAEKWRQLVAHFSQPVLAFIPHDEVIHVSHIASAAELLLDVMVQHGQVVIGEKLTGQVADWQALARCGFATTADQ